MCRFSPDEAALVASLADGKWKATLLEQIERNNFKSVRLLFVVRPRFLLDLVRAGTIAAAQGSQAELQRNGVNRATTPFACCRSQADAHRVPHGLKLQERL